MNYFAIPHVVKTIVKLYVKKALAKLSLVPMEEFEIQKKILARTRQRLEALEQKLANFDKKPNNFISSNAD